MLVRAPRTRLYPLERWLLACTLVLVALAWWVIADALPEGPILWTALPGKGLTAIDLPGVGLVLIAAWLFRPTVWLRLFRRR